MTKITINKMSKNSEKQTGPDKEKRLINILITLLALPVIVIVGGFLFILFGTAELLTINEPSIRHWPILWLLLGIFGIPLLILWVILFWWKWWNR